MNDSRIIIDDEKLVFADDREFDSPMEFSRAVREAFENNDVEKTGWKEFAEKESESFRRLLLAYFYCYGDDSKKTIRDNLHKMLTYIARHSQSWLGSWKDYHKEYEVGLDLWEAEDLEDWFYDPVNIVWYEIMISCNQDVLDEMSGVFLKSGQKIVGCSPKWLKDNYDMFDFKKDAFKEHIVAKYLGEDGLKEYQKPDDPEESEEEQLICGAYLEMIMNFPSFKEVDSENK